ncbi:hypothetical protein LBMAG46_34770 [Planctomycetia bacterium]|nr:hypothetical protein LBMAG46_34770 [Planctomycetia bacterium]
MGQSGGEGGVTQTFGGDEEYIELILFECVEDGVPVIDVGAVDAGGCESGFFGGGHLVAHQCEQW